LEEIEGDPSGIEEVFMARFLVKDDGTNVVTLRQVSYGVELWVGDSIVAFFDDADGGFHIERAVLNQLKIGLISEES
jgi:hypothetical protein